MTVIHALLTVLQLIQIIIMQTPVHMITIITDFIDMLSVAQLLGCGPSGLLDNVLHALRALRPCDSCNSAMMG